MTIQSSRIFFSQNFLFVGVGDEWLDVQLGQRFNVPFKDKGAARFLERVKGAAPFAEK